MKVSGFRLLLAKVSLSQPYYLSFTTVKWVDSVLVSLSFEDGRTGLGEAVPLPGYSHETLESIIADLHSILPNMLGLEAAELPSYLKIHLPHSPFAVSALLVAKEFALGEVKLPNQVDIPMVAPVSATNDPKVVLEESTVCWDEGYRTIKLKVGRDIESDLRSASTLLDELPEEVKIRIDANHLYSVDHAKKLARIIAEHPNNSRVECFEQPLGINAWDHFRLLANEFKTVPFMLDESIIYDTDIEKAAEVGARLIKLKLFKHRSVREVIRLAKLAGSIGLNVIFGNGVASDVGNLAEAAAVMHENLFFGAFEGNGFTKLSHPILGTPPVQEQGNMRWSPPNNGVYWTLNTTGVTFKRLICMGDC